MRKLLILITTVLSISGCSFSYTYQGEPSEPKKTEKPVKEVVGE